MATSKRLSPLLSLPLLLLSCQSHRAINVTQNEFADLYLRPRYDLHHVDDDGVKGGYHYLTEQNAVRYGNAMTNTQLYRTPDSPAVRKLVSTPQAPIKHDPTWDIPLTANPIP